jgi:hypothetical protein
VSNKAKKLLESMRRSSANWKRSDLDSLYTGFGFVIIHSGKHDTVKHPQYPHLLTRLPRHKVLAKAYVKQAVELVDKLIELMKEEKNNE